MKRASAIIPIMVAASRTLQSSAVSPAAQSSAQKMLLSSCTTSEITVSCAEGDQGLSPGVAEFEIQNIDVSNRGVNCSHAQHGNPAAAYKWWRVQLMASVCPHGSLSAITRVHPMALVHFERLR
jgi:hypothetical protein